MSTFEVNQEKIIQILGLIEQKDDQNLKKYLNNFHFADIAEIIEHLPQQDALYLFKLVEPKISADALAEIDEDRRFKILKKLTNQEIAKEVEELETDDAADIIAELSEERQAQVMSEISDDNHLKDIQELLQYDENTAGALMAKELVKVHHNVGVVKCMEELRAIAKDVKRVHSIYVVDDGTKLLGRLSLKDLITAKEDAIVNDIYIPKVNYVTDAQPIEEVIRIIRKYDLEAIPVVNDEKQLLGRITIDDIVDIIQESAEEDYLLGAGVSAPVDADDTVSELILARLPWLFLGLLGGIGSVFILQGFESIMRDQELRSLFFYTPLIAAMAGNVGVQSSAIIVQGISNNNIKESILRLLFKEIILCLVNGLALSVMVVTFGIIIGQQLYVSLTISASLLIVIILAGSIGTIVPLILNRYKYDPALATGPFITTSNDILGILVFFYLAKLLLGF